MFPYGYFQYARFSQQGGKDMVQIQFLDQIVMVKGAGLASLCDALARFAVTNLWERPEKYTSLRKNHRNQKSSQDHRRRRFGQDDKEPRGCGRDLKEAPEVPKVL